MMQEWADYPDGLRNGKTAADTPNTNPDPTPVNPPSGKPNVVVRRGGKAL
jgi:hypothetical protein